MIIGIEISSGLPAENMPVRRPLLVVTAERDLLAEPTVAGALIDSGRTGGRALLLIDTQHVEIQVVGDSIWDH
jgi:hypothetical protein